MPSAFLPALLPGRIGSNLTSAEQTIRNIPGGKNMPAFAGNVSPQELSDLVGATIRVQADPLLHQEQFDVVAR